MKTNLNSSWNKFQNVMIGLLSIIGVNSFITSFELKCAVNLIAFIMLLTYCAMPEKIEKESNSHEKSNKKKPKTNLNIDVLEDMGYTPPLEDSQTTIKDLEFIKAILRFQSFTESQINHYISQTSFTDSDEMIKDCVKMKKYYLEKDKKNKFNSKNPSEVVIETLWSRLEDANDSDIIKCISRCKSATNEEAIEWCVKEYNSGNYLTSSVAPNKSEEKMINDVADVLMTYKKYSRKEALEVARTIEGSTLEERIIAAFKAT